MGDYWNEDTYGDDNGFNCLADRSEAAMADGNLQTRAAPALSATDKVNAAGKVMKIAKLKDLAIRCVKATDGGATFNAASDDHSHVKVDFIAFNMDEERPKFKGGTEVVSANLVAKQHPAWAMKMKMKVGGEEFEVNRGTASKLTCLFAKVALPTQGLISMEYMSPHGEIRYVDDHPINIDFGGAADAKSGGACSIQ